MKPLLVALVALAAVHGTVEKNVRTFTEDAVGAPPPGFTFVGASETQPRDRWLIQREIDNRFLAHAADPQGGGLSVGVLDQVACKDVAIAVRLKLVGGERSGGFVWRYQDVGNAYMARLDLHDQKMGLYRLVRGNRIRIDVKDDLELDPLGWHVLKVVHDNDRIRVYLGGIKVFDVRDRTFPDSGGVGLWSSGGSVAYFDDLRVEDRGGRTP